MHSLRLFLILLVLLATSRAADVEQWGMYELTLKGPESGYPFTEV